ncbi:MAG: type II/IV secretion system protein [Oligoflexia bacterium]|nr:type II/IV secretion system protein [Oligoflexia bacterium]
MFIKNENLGIKTKSSRRPLSDIMIELGFLNREKMEFAIDKAKKEGKRYGAYLLENKYLTEIQYAKCMALHFNMPFKDLINTLPQQSATSQIPVELASKFSILAHTIENNILQISVHDPMNILHISQAKNTLKNEYEIYISPLCQINTLIGEHYYINNLSKNGPLNTKKENANSSLKDIFFKKNNSIIKNNTPLTLVSNATSTTITTKSLFTNHNTKSSAITQNPSSPATTKSTETTNSSNGGSIDSNSNSDELLNSITVIINKIIERAITQGSSDIHIEPDDDKLRVRERIDGILHEKEIFPMDFHPMIISKIKVLASLDIAEKRVSQDGRFNYGYAGKVVDFRVSTLPTVKGEKAVLRLLDKGNLKINLEELGMNEKTIKDIKNALIQPYGIILVTGPTGSGKTTTVYSMLNCINDLERNIITVEDPVEYRFPIVNQVQVNTKVGLTFPVVLRTILRQDPDVIMIGEIRDKETADIAIRAALTGHLVISTLHTNDSLKTIDRLVDIGIEPYIITSSLLAIVAQRLARRVCHHCKVKEDRQEKLDLIPIDKAKLEVFKGRIYKSIGCEKCFNTGYSGRIALYEMLIPNAKIGRAIKDRVSTEELYTIATQSGFKTIQDNAFESLFNGDTTIEEIIDAVGVTNKYT